ncbi:hypothetical protein [Tindallia californiensis]|uniref:Uncharacterized protein n=1 Tax=Tindallia californiensis TaxID=159292 RepID=A0A1H3QZU7_9FIRM|nr:hypothetical protein [Tindallia californiensis]SDZ18876.1 hypothetical protein SAMN05192546_11151 [Tindallia californiensis]
MENEKHTQNDNTAASDSLKNLIDFKKFSISQFNYLLETLNQENENDGVKIHNSIILLTNFGMVYCSPTSFNVDEDRQSNTSTEENQTVLSRKMLELRNKNLELELDENPNLRVQNVASVITLKNVKLRPFASHAEEIPLPELILFTEHICGIAYGEIKKT